MTKSIYSIYNHAHDFGLFFMQFYLAHDFVVCYNIIKEVFAMAGNAEYKNQWQKNNCDRINLTVSKGKKEIIKAHAEQQSESTNSFINRAIDETMKRDSEKGAE